MRNTMLSVILCFSGFATTSYADQANQQIEAQLGQLANVDRQIENLIQQKMKLRAQADQIMGRGDVAVRPREERKTSRQAEQIKDQIDEINQKLSALENERTQILSGLQ